MNRLDSPRPTIITFRKRNEIYAYTFAPQQRDLVLQHAIAQAKDTSLSLDLFDVALLRHRLAKAP